MGAALAKCLGAEPSPPYVVFTICPCDGQPHDFSNGKEFCEAGGVGFAASSLCQKCGQTKQQADLQDLKHLMDKLSASHGIGHDTELEHQLKKQKQVKERKEKKEKKAKKEKKEKKEKRDKNVVWERLDEKANEPEDEKGSDEEVIVSKHLSEIETAGQPIRPAVLRVKGYGSEEVYTVIKTLRTYVEKTGAHMTLDDFFDELRLAQLAEVFDHKMRLYVALEALLGPKMDAHSVLAQKDYITKAIDNASMPSHDVLWAFGAYIEAHPTTAKSFPMVLKTIYDEDWATEEDILEYYGTDLFSSEPGFLTAQKCAAPFLRWLSTVGSEDEDEDDE